MKRYLFTILFLFFININVVLAYNNTIVHPGITNEAINLYLRNGNESKISNKQSASILKGAENEDIDPRYLNHFYNPYNNKSLLEAFGVAMPTAKEWAFFQFSASGDFSVPTILDNYREGNTKRAFEGVGHILHLVQDMGTPAHVRVDPHPPGDADGLEIATEKYAKYGFVDEIYFKKDIVNIFDEFAKYTVNNFYSDDRIDNLIELSGFQSIKEIDGVVYDYGLKDNHIVCRIKKQGERNLCYLTSFVYKYYWQELYPKTVTYSASAIDWFMDEFEKIDKEKEQLSFWDKALNKIKSTPLALADSVNYIWGDAYLATRDGVVTSFKGVGYFTTGMGDAVYYSGLAMDSISDTIIRSTVEIAREGTIGTLSSMGEASLLGGFAIEKTFDFTADTSGKVLSSFEEGIRGVKEVASFLPELSEILVLGVESEEIVLESDKGDDEPLESDNDGTWIPRNNVLLFTGGGSSSPLGEENTATSGEEVAAENIQDLSTITFEIFDINTNNKEFTSSTSVGVLVDIYDLNNLEYYLSESSSSDDIIWSNIVFDSFELSEGVGQKNIYLFIRDSDSVIIIESSIILDLNLPVVEIIFGPAYYSSSTEASFLFTASCVPSIFEYSFNDEIFQISDLSESISEGRIFAEGLNTLKIRIKDNLERMASSSFEWIVDFNSPEIFYINTNFYDDEVVLSWDISSTTGLVSPIKYFELEKFVDSEFNESYVIAPDVFSTSTSAQNDLSFRIRAVDMADNIGNWLETGILFLEQINDRVLISEVGIKDAEFIELYNPTEDDVLISSWYLAYYSSEDDWNSPSHLLEIRPAEIESKGFFSISITDNEINIADDSFNYPGDMLNSLGGSFALFDSNPEEEVVPVAIDSVGWGEAHNIFEFEPILLNADTISIERKANFRSSEESMLNIEEDMFLGNGYDTNNNEDDFVFHSLANPQGNISSFEPRELTTPEPVGDFKVDYIDNDSVGVSWTDLSNYNIEIGALYEIFYVKNDDCDNNIDWQNADSLIVPSRYQKKYFIAMIMADPPYTFQITDLLDDTNYCLAIKVFNGETWSYFSNAVSVKTKIKELTIIRTNSGSFNRSVLTKEDSPYLINDIFYLKNTHLTIEPGVVIKITDTYHRDNLPTRILVSSSITAIGTEDEPIIFTSYKDDEVAGDSNMDGDETTPVSGSWGGIEFYLGGSTFNNVQVKYAGRGSGTLGFFNLFGPNNIIENSYFIENKKDVVIINSSTSTEATIFRNNVFINTESDVRVIGDGAIIVENNIVK